MTTPARTWRPTQCPGPRRIEPAHGSLRCLLRSPSLTSYSQRVPVVQSLPSRLLTALAALLLVSLSGCTIGDPGGAGPAAGMPADAGGALFRDSTTTGRGDPQDGNKRPGEADDTAHGPSSDAGAAVGDEGWRDEEDGADGIGTDAGDPGTTEDGDGGAHEDTTGDSTEDTAEDTSADALADTVEDTLLPDQGGDDSDVSPPGGEDVWSEDASEDGAGDSGEDAETDAPTEATPR